MGCSCPNRFGLKKKGHWWYPALCILLSRTTVQSDNWTMGALWKSSKPQCTKKECPSGLVLSTLNFQNQDGTQLGNSHRFQPNKISPSTQAPLAQRKRSLSNHQPYPTTRKIIASTSATRAHRGFGRNLASTLTNSKVCSTPISLCGDRGICPCHQQIQSTRQTNVKQAIETVVWSNRCLHGLRLHALRADRGDRVLAEQLEVEPVCLRLRLPVGHHPAEIPPQHNLINLNPRSQNPHGIELFGGGLGGETRACSGPRGEQREGEERGDEAGRHGLVQHLPHRARVVREAQVGHQRRGERGPGPAIDGDGGGGGLPGTAPVAAAGGR